MRIVVLGAGLLGVTSAYFLAARGHDVEVIERQNEAGSETSYANGGQLSFSHAEPWANPAVLPKVLRWMFRKDAPLVLRFSPDPHMIRWGLSFLRNCTGSRATANSVNILRLGLYSKNKLEQLRAVTGIKFDNIREGILHIFSEEDDYAHAIQQSHFQEKFGCKEDVLDLQACLRMEPTLQYTNRKIIGGIHAPLDESGDALTYTRELAKVCTKEFGTEFLYGVTVNRLRAEKGRIIGVDTDKGEVKADAYVMAMGSYSSVYLRQIGIHVPVYPMKGYSITLAANQFSPTISLTDSELKIVYSRLGNKLRIAGTAEFAGYNTKITEHRVEPLVRAVRELFPKAPHDGTIDKWACLRPSTPDGPPIIGKCKIENLFLNTGHGTLGWTQAPGSGMLLADIMENRPTEISMDGLTINRY